jgi:hypothetical protein
LRNSRRVSPRSFKHRRPLLFVILASLFAWIASCDDDPMPPQNGDHTHEPGICGHIDARGAVLETHGVLHASTWDGAVTGQLETRVSALLHDVEVIFLAADSTRFSVADSCLENHMEYTIADSNVVSLSRDPGIQWTFHLFGKQVGTTTLTLQGWHADHAHVSIGPIPVSVTTLQEPGSP